MRELEWGELLEKAYEVKQDLNCIKFLDLKSGQKIENMEFYSRPISCIEE